MGPTNSRELSKAFSSIRTERCDAPAGQSKETCDAPQEGSMEDCDMSPYQHIDTRSVLLCRHSEACYVQEVHCPKVHIKEKSESKKESQTKENEVGEVKAKENKKLYA
ncbi:hypothetical protein HAX54_019178 [Datura stramonium]|uniref:Uncharacterized protein n=1 Tax=Datura stramonium TaxID=4076 RepID=A0ABS8UQP0_DATST|nr:hypothetical protein [Datura stramonium]